jgi:GNAT superfamily N-acetyltransferase
MGIATLNPSYESFDRLMTSESITLREATEADVEALHRLIVAIADHHGQREYVFVTVDDLRRDGFGPAPKFGAVLAEVDGALVGYASYTWSYAIWLGAAYMSVDDVFVSASLRGLGVGEALMRTLKQVCADRGLQRLRWEVQPDNTAAIRFYERIGARMRTKGIFYWDV